MIGTGAFWLIVAWGAAWTAWGPGRWRDAGLASLAVVLLAWKEPVSLVIYAGLAALAWSILRQGAHHARAAGVMVGTLAIGLAVLKWLQSADDAGGPLGLSYLVFRLIHVLVEGMRGQLPPPGAAEFAHYVLSPAMFSAGPLERWPRFAGNRVPALNGEIWAEGIQRICVGLVKKLLIADVALVAVATTTLGAGATFSAARDPAELWLGAALCYLRIYVEFSGYSDIAVGVGLLWGRRLMENFHWPVLALTPADFWRRWHVSLAQWCSAYIYMPLLGWMRSRTVPLFAAFLVMGLWHMIGWNRVGWAAWQTLGVLAHAGWMRALGRPEPGSWRTGLPWKIASWLLLQAFVTAGYVFAINGEDKPLVEALQNLARMFGLPAFFSRA